MPRISCKMCGGEVELPENMFSGECPYCGTYTTFPKVNGPDLENLYNRAEHFRKIGEFDKALGVYEKILQESADDPEASWGLVLCRYGIEYVEDPLTHERIPTCHRVQYESILADSDYLAALDRAGAVERDLYEQEANRIAEIQKKILAISAQEKPVDVFICYKESTDGGSRTQDSVLAQDIYHQLTKEGLNVFFARISLESRLGQEYEPYIFAALNSAKVMLVIGTKPEYFNAVWVKNEWSRYLALIRKDRSRVLIPCYKDMTAYDLPEELGMFQAQDMSRIGFLQDILHGVKKVAKTAKPEEKHATTAAAPHQPTVKSLLKRAKLFLENGDFESTNEYCERVLDLDPEIGEAYLLRLMAEAQVQDQMDLVTIDLESDKTFKLAMRFADAEQKKTLSDLIEERNRLVEEWQQQLEAKKRIVEEKRKRKIAEIKLRSENEQQKRKRVKIIWGVSIVICLVIALGIFIATRPSEIARLAEEQGLHLNQEETAIVGITHALKTNCVIPDGITHIGSNVFSNCKTLTGITIPDSVTSIGEGAFFGCTNLTRITIPNSVTSIGNRAFLGCKSFKTITIPDSVTSIGGGVFDGCTNLMSITIPDSVTSIGYRAFYGCTNLSIVTLGKGIIGNWKSYLPFEQIEHITIPDSVTSIGEYAFKGCTSLKTITIPDSVTSIGKYAFKGCTSLTSINIPNSVTSIGDSAFSGCENLKTITIPDSVTSIGEYAFYGCTSLKTITLPAHFTDADVRNLSVPYGCRIIRR